MPSNKFIIKMDAADLVPKTTARIYYFAAMLITVLQGVAIGVLWRYIPRVVPLFFTRPWGEARLAPKLYLIVLPILSLGAIMVNLVLGRGAKSVSGLLPYVLAVSSLIVTIMFSIALFGILQSLL